RAGSPVVLLQQIPDLIADPSLFVEGGYIHRDGQAHVSPRPRTGTAARQHVKHHGVPGVGVQRYRDGNEEQCFKQHARFLVLGAVGYRSASRCPPTLQVDIMDVWRGGYITQVVQSSASGSARLYCQIKTCAIMSI